MVNVRKLTECTFFYHGATALVGQDLLTIKNSLTHSDKPHSVGLLWTSDHPDAETSNLQHTALTRDRHPCPQWYLKPQFQQASSCRPTP
jgi:hypothetical protein